MQCIFLFKDDQGRLPTAQELSQRGFVVSAAVLPEKDVAPGRGLALAAEPPTGYGLQAAASAKAADETASRGGS